MSKQKKKQADPLRRAFGQRVRALRKAAGMSQMDLGQKAGLDHTYIGSIERGERNLSLDAIGKIAKGLSVEIADLFRFSSTQAAPADPHLIELITLLEKRDSKTVEMVRSLLRWKDEG